MKKKQLTKIIKAGAAVLLAGALCGCSVKFGTKKQPKPNKVVAHATGGDNIEDMNITYERFRKEYWYVLAKSDIHDDTNLDEYMDAQCKAQRGKAIQYLINEQVIMTKAKELGVFELTAEEQAEVDKDYEEMVAAEIQAQADAVVTEMTLAAIEEANSNGTEIALPELSDEEKEALGKERFEKNLEECGMTYDDLKWWAQTSRIADKVYDSVVADVTQADIDAEYAALLAEAKEFYNDSISNFFQVGYGDVWLPDDARLIKHVLLGFDEETQQQIYNLRQDFKNTDANKLREEAAAALEEKTAEVQQKLDDGAKLDDIITEYTADKSGWEAYPNGYTVVPNDTRWMDEFTKGAFELENIGDRTVVVTDYGVHIMVYAGNAKVDTMEKYKDMIKTNLQNKKYSATVDSWITEYAYEIDYETLRIDDPNATASTETEG
ncbi:MAG: peptidylprolyl isomerase [Oscillospiraceae bacterium]|nr:peptidylprolyl isomerase [Oscillospiraceae bacterium]